MLFQRGDTLSYRDRSFELIDQPLEAYFALINSRPQFARSSEQSRGYVANWMIEDGWLYLTSIAALWEDATPVSLKHLFPVAGDKVFAAWLTGQLRGYRSDASPLSLSTMVRSPDLVMHVNCGRINGSSMVHRPAIKSQRPADVSPKPASVIDLKTGAEVS
jgi:hypothetical protein